MVKETITPVRRYTRLRRALKAVEQLFKHTALAVLTRLAAPGSQAAPDWNASTLRVLFLRHDRIGDMILTTAAIRAIAQSRSNIELDVLASPLNAAVVEKDPWVNRVVRFNVRGLADWLKLVPQLRRARYDVVVDCMVFTQSLTTMLLMLATGAPHRVGVLKPGKPNVYTMSAELAEENAHHVEHLAQLAVPFGVAPQDALKLGIALNDTEREVALEQWDCGERRRVLVNISAGKAFRQWPDHNFVAVAQHLKAQLPDARIMVLHGPTEWQRAQSIADAAGVTRAHTPSLREALALAATADFIFTPDTSILHAASTFRIPTVAMINTDHAVRWGLFRTLGEVVAAPGHTLASVALDDMIGAIDKILVLSGLNEGPVHRRAAIVAGSVDPVH